MSKILEGETDDWSELEEELEMVDTERVKEQLNVQVSAEIVYPDERSSKWYHDLAENYEKMVDAFGGEEEVDQYLEIQPQGVKVSVEQKGEELFTVYTVEPGEKMVQKPRENFESVDYN